MRGLGKQYFPFKQNTMIFSDK